MKAENDVRRMADTDLIGSVLGIDKTGVTKEM
jgi:hypothetical protein